jgi:hypothetical protein
VKEALPGTGVARVLDLNRASGHTARRHAYALVGWRLVLTSGVRRDLLNPMGEIKLRELLARGRSGPERGTARLVARSGEAG